MNQPIDILDITEDVRLRAFPLDSIQIREDDKGHVNTVPGDILFVDVAACHAERLNYNFRWFTTDCLKHSLRFWTKDFNKPVLKNHDPYSDPLGRVVSASIDQEEDGTSFQKLTLGIIDPDAIQKILDGRYLTGSVGGKALDVRCSICGKHIAKDGAPSEDACRHYPGYVYKGKRAYMIYDNVRWVEYSFVAQPADPTSKAISTRFAAKDEDLAEYAPTFYFLPNREEKILTFHDGETYTIELSDSDDSRNGVYLAFREAADGLLEHARLQVVADSANPEVMEVIEGVPEHEKGQSVAGEDILDILKEVRDALKGNPPEEKPPLDDTDTGGSDATDAKWDTAYVNALPDIAFALVKRPVKDKQRDRALPHHSKGVTSASENGSVDKPHLRNALARANQVKGFSAQARSSAVGHLKKHASALGVGDEEIEELLTRGEEALTDEEKELWEFLNDSIEETPEETLEDPKPDDSEERPEETIDNPTPNTEDTEEESVTDDKSAEGKDPEPTDQEGEPADKEGTDGTEEIVPGDSEEAGETAAPEDIDKSPEETQDNEQPAEETSPEDGDLTVEELRAENQRLRELELNLRKEVRFLVAERVVEEMVKVGEIQESQRVEELTKHQERALNSLKDKLSDLLSRKDIPTEKPDPIDETSVKTGSNLDEIVEDKEKPAPPPKTDQDRYVEGLTRMLSQPRTVEDVLREKNQE